MVGLYSETLEGIGSRIEHCDEPSLTRLLIVMQTRSIALPAGNNALLARERSTEFAGRDNHSFESQQNPEGNKNNVTR
jgi:hypothetical protein